MQGTMLYGPRDIRFEDRPDPTITKPTDAGLICGPIAASVILQSRPLRWATNTAAS